MCFAGAIKTTHTTKSIHQRKQNKQLTPTSWAHARTSVFLPTPCGPKSSTLLTCTGCVSCTACEPSGRMQYCVMTRRTSSMDGVGSIFADSLAVPGSTQGVQLEEQQQVDEEEVAERACVKVHPWVLLTQKEGHTRTYAHTQTYTKTARTHA